MHAKSTSCLRTFCNKRENIYGLNEVATLNKRRINLAIQYGLNNGTLAIASNLAIVSSSHNRDGITLTRDFEKACKSLSRFLTPHDVVTAYRMLGVMSL